MAQKKPLSVLWDTLHHPDFVSCFPSFAFEGKVLTGPYFVKEDEATEIMGSIFTWNKCFSIPKQLGAAHFAGSLFRLEEEDRIVTGESLGYKTIPECEIGDESLRLIVYTKNVNQPTGYFEMELSTATENRGVTLSIYLHKIYVIPQFRNTNNWLILTTAVARLLEEIFETMLCCLPKNKRLNTIVLADYVSLSGERIGDGIFNNLRNLLDSIKDYYPEQAHLIGWLKHEVII